MMQPRLTSSLGELSTKYSVLIMLQVVGLLFATSLGFAQCPMEKPIVAKPVVAGIVHPVSGAVSDKLSAAAIDTRIFLQHPDRRVLEATALSAQTISEVESAWRSVLTQHNDNQRTGAYLSETVLTPQSLRVNDFGLKATYPVEGRVDAQLLYVHGIPVNGALHNVLYAVTMCNYVYAFDADTADGGHLWPGPVILSEEDPFDQWTLTAGAPVAAGDPVTMVTPDQQHPNQAPQHIFYRGTDGTINHIYWDGSFHRDSWTAAAGAPPAAGDPVTMVTPNPLRPNETQQHVFYRGTDGAINHVSWDGSFHRDTWTTVAEAPPAAGDPVTMVTPNPYRPNETQQHVFYRGTDGAINHIHWDGSFHHDTWTTAAGAPPAAGDPATMVTPNQQHIFYRGTDGAINHIYWDGSFHRDTWTTAAWAPPAAGNPATMITPNQQHIFYRGTDGALNHILWQRRFARGILSTPVIDLPNRVMYVVYSTKNQVQDTSCPSRLTPCITAPRSPVEEKPDPHPADVPDLDNLDVAFWLAAIDIQNGKFLRQRPITASIDDDQGRPVGFEEKDHLNRPGLLLDGDSLYIAFGMRPMEGEHEFHGWVMEYDAASFQQKGVFNTSRNWIFDATRADVEGAGVWQSGAGLLADGSGAVYLTTGNGKKVLEGHYFGDLVLKVRDGLPRDHSASFTPSELGLKEVTYALDGAAPPNVYHYKVNANGDPRHLQVSCNPEPAGTKVLERSNDISYLLDFQDLDLSSGGPMLIPGTSILVAGGKTGVMYLLDSSTMQRIQEFAFSTDLDAPCRRYDFQNGPHLHGAPTYWSISDSLAYIYHWGEKDFLRGYPFVTTTGKVDTEHPICSFRRSIQNTADPGSASKCQTPSGSILFERVRASKCQMPGGSISVSGNQSGGTAVIWATAPLDRGGTVPLPEADKTAFLK